MAKVFVSYRREDSAGHAGRLIDRMRQRFGEDNVFMDVDNIPVGHSFKSVIESAVSHCDVVLVVIGQAWLDCRDGATGTRRLDQADDWVRIETAKALERGIPVVPVLVQGARLPAADALPDELKPLATRQTAVLVDAQWDATVGDLLRRLAAMPALADSRRRWLRMAVAVSCVMALLAIGLMAWRAPWRPAEGSTSRAKSGLFTTHGAVGGYWYEYKFSAYIAFLPDGSIAGKYYQYQLTGFWSPVDAQSLRFSAFLVKPEPGMKMQWQPGMSATVTGDTLELTWPDGQRDNLVRRQRLP